MTSGCRGAVYFALAFSADLVAAATTFTVTAN
jgi:hypothetical protein